MNNGYMQAEGVANLDQVPATGALVAIGFPRLKGGTGGFASFTAICPADWTHGLRPGDGGGGASRLQRETAGVERREGRARTHRALRQTEGETQFQSVERFADLIEAISDMPWFMWPLLVVGVPILLVLVLAWLVAAVLLLVLVWLTWVPRGRHALVVYSASPVWQPVLRGHCASCSGAQGRRAELVGAKAMGLLGARVAVLHVRRPARIQPARHRVQTVSLASAVSVLQAVCGLQTRASRRGSGGDARLPRHARTVHVENRGLTARGESRTGCSRPWQVGKETVRSPTHRISHPRPGYLRTARPAVETAF